jgi:hypothetical protein
MLQDIQRYRSRCEELSKATPQLFNVFTLGARYYAEATPHPQTCGKSGLEGCATAGRVSAKLWTVLRRPWRGCSQRSVALGSCVQVFSFLTAIANTLSENEHTNGMIRGGLYSRQLDLVSKLATPILMESCKMHVANV